MALEDEYSAFRDAPGKLSQYLKQYPKFGDALRSCAARVQSSSGTALCNELQEAHWFYEDSIVEGARGHFPSLRQSVFFAFVLETSQVLREVYSSSRDREQVFDDWRRHLKTVPRSGAVLFDESREKCLMVQSHKSGVWSFPSGKLEAGEREVDCATREVWEEINLDISPCIDETQYVSAGSADSGGTVKLFIIGSLPAGLAGCKPNVKKEVAKIAWIPTRKLPGWAHDDLGDSKLKFLGNVQRFAPKLKRWLESVVAAGGSGKAAPQTTATAPLVKNQDVHQRAWLNLEPVMLAFDRNWK